MTKRERIRASRRGGKIGGKSRSEAKIRAVRENGKRGGRPSRLSKMSLGDAVALAVQQEWARLEAQA